MDQLTIKTSELRSMPLDELPEVLLLGFLKPTLTERAVRVGEWLKQKRAGGFAINLVVDDGRPVPIGWRYLANEVIEA